MILSYKYRIYPNKKQQELIKKTFDCSRFVYNYFLDLRITEYEKNKKNFNCYETIKMLTPLKNKKGYEWLLEPDKNALQNSLKDLHNAYTNFFKENAGYPKFKSKKNNRKSYRTNCNYSNRPNYNYANIRYEGNHIRLPKLGNVKIKDKRIPQGRILNATIVQEPDGNYFCILCCENIEIKSLSKTNENIGIDLGLIDFAIFSDGTKIENYKFYEQSEKRIVKLQKELSRKSRGSNNWNKARIKLAKEYKKITNKRQDFLHKLSTNIIKNYDIICIEDLNIQSMKETFCKIHNKRVADVAWSEFRRQLTYKCQLYSKRLIVVDRYYPSSQICSNCGTNSGKKKVTIRKWKCSNCNSVLDRDVNASINILNEGLRIINN